MRFRVSDLRFRVWAWSWGFKVEGFGFRVGLVCMVSGLEFRVYRVRGFASRVQNQAIRKLGVGLAARLRADDLREHLRC